MLLCKLARNRLERSSGLATSDESDALVASSHAQGLFHTTLESLEISMTVQLKLQLPDRFRCQQCRSVAGMWVLKSCMLKAL